MGRAALLGAAGALILSLTALLEADGSHARSAEDYLLHLAGGRTAAAIRPGMHECSWPGGFNHTMGFPGEGPSVGGEAAAGCVWVGTANATAWSSFIAADLMTGAGGTAVGAWCVQETKLNSGRKRRKARALVASRGWAAALGMARAT